MAAEQDALKSAVNGLRQTSLHVTNRRVILDRAVLVSDTLSKTLPEAILHVSDLLNNRSTLWLEDTVSRSRKLWVHALHSLSSQRLLLLQSTRDHLLYWPDRLGYLHLVCHF